MIRRNMAKSVQPEKDHLTEDTAITSIKDSNKNKTNFNLLYAITSHTSI